ncbi:MAG TPA: TonB-dependent receptor [Prolixibacteraceae bacterium]|nr:TonB-dependent receptor [Prolixibacteraceae bacterium]
MNLIHPKCILLCIFLMFSSTLFAQKLSIFGSVKDASTGETLIGAVVLVKETNQIVVTNNYGFYSISPTSGKFTVVCSYLGYASFIKPVEIGKSTELHIELSPQSKSLNEVIIHGHKSTIHSTSVSKTTIQIKQIKAIPSMTGEPDVLKSLQLLPGVQTAGEGSTNLSVRGGSFDQNLIILDEAPVYNPSHALGFFSTFNTDALNNVSFYKGAFPAQYGGRLSSIVDITMREGNYKKYAANVGIGLLASKATLEGPIIKDKASFIISGRYSYAGQTLNLTGKFGQEVLQLWELRNFNDQNEINFYDLNAKMNYKINDKNHLYLSAYTGGDRFYSFSLNNSNSLEWGNFTSTLRWNHIFSSSLFSNFTSYYSNYNYSYFIGDDLRNFTWKSNIQEGGLKADFSAYLNSSNHVKFGASTVYHYFDPGQILPLGNHSSVKPFSLSKKNALETSVYLSNEQKLSQRLSLDYGIRYAGFINIGPDTVFKYNEEKTQVIGFEDYKSGEIVQFYHSLEPRISARYLLGFRSSVKLAYGRTTQFLHLLSNSALGLPTDVWMPPDKNIRPQSSDQLVLGYYRSISNNKYEFTTEVYYKTLKNIIDFKENANLFMNKHIDTQILSGDGYAYGNEYMLEKKSGKLTGWIAYTFSKTQYRIEGINENRYYSPRWDIRNNLSITGNYPINQKWSVSSTFKFTSGGFVTIPEGSFLYNGSAFVFYSERNGYQVEPYHRLDVSFIYKPSKNNFRKRQSEWIFGIYNIYDRKNIYTLFAQPEQGPGSTSFNKMYLFGIVPSVTYHLKF